MLDEFVSFLPVFEEVALKIVPHADVHIVEQTGKKVVDFASDVQNIVNAGRE